MASPLWHAHTEETLQRHSQDREPKWLKESVFLDMTTAVKTLAGGEPWRHLLKKLKKSAPVYHLLVLSEE